MSSHALDAPAQPLTLAEWFDLPEDVTGELVDGCLVEEEMPEAAHEFTITWLVVQLYQWLLPLGGGVAGSGLKLGISARRGRVPDTCVYLSGRKPPRRHNRLPPDIAIEVISPTRKDQRRDRVEKPLEYAAFGIRYYILVDPEARVVEAFCLADSGRYERVAAASDGIIAIPGCDGLSLDLDAMWKYVDDNTGADEPDDAS